MAGDAVSLRNEWHWRNECQSGAPICRALQEGLITRVGGAKPVQVDVRVLAAPASPDRLLGVKRWLGGAYTRYAEA